MAFVKNLFDKNFIEYASYVIRDRAIPDIEDGLKPVQRRIMHTLFEMDDGRFQKVATVVGRCMKYHPHGDASIGGALVVLANREYFIEKQGNFGNIYTGDSASAPRYIECRVNQIAKDFLYNPNVTQYVPSYDGRSKEPVVFRAKLPLVLLTAAEGIAVGMNTRILPYNIREVIDAEKKCLNGEPFKLNPDFPTGGLLDVSNYNDGTGKIVTRAKFDISDEKKIVITELPYPSTTESLISSIENAAKNGKIKISSIHDLTAKEVNIEIKLPRGVYAKDVVDSLYAYTDCEQSVSANMLVIKDNMPVQVTATEVIQFHAEQLKGILKDELEFERNALTDKLHQRTLERIFVEERIYKLIETQKTQAAVEKAVLDGFVPHKDELVREISGDDIEKLLSIPIRRISLYDMSKNKAEVTAINKRLREIAKLLKNLTGYAVSYLESLEEKIKVAKIDTKRKTTVKRFSAVDAREIAKRSIPLRYDDKGYLGTGVSGGSEIMKVSEFDKIICMRRNGMYTAMDVPAKVFIDKSAWFVSFADKEEIAKVLITVIFKDAKTGFASIKRTRITTWIMNRDYFIAPDGAEILHVDTRADFSFTLKYQKKARASVLEETFRAGDFEEKGLKTLGIRLSSRECEGIVVDGAPANGIPETIAIPLGDEKSE